MLNSEQRRNLGRAVLIYDLLTVTVAGTILLPHCANKEETTESAIETKKEERQEGKAQQSEEENLEQVLYNFPYFHEQQLRENAEKNCLEEIWIYDGREWYDVTKYAAETFAIMDKKKVEEVMKKNKRKTIYMYHTHPATAWEIFPPSDADLFTHDRWKKESQRRYGFVVSRIVDPQGVWEYDTGFAQREQPMMKIMVDLVVDRRENPYSKLAEPVEQALLDTAFQPREVQVEVLKEVYRSAGVSIKFTTYKRAETLDIKWE